MVTIYTYMNQTNTYLSHSTQTCLYLNITLKFDIIIFFYRLVHEISEIQSTMRELDSKLREAQSAHQYLQETKARMQQDLEVSRHAILFIGCNPILKL